jgi:hypothetical protein
MKKLIFACLLIGGTAFQAQAGDCTALYQDVLYKQALSYGDAVTVVGVGTAPVDLIQEHLKKASSYFANYFGTRTREYRLLDGARALLRVQDPSQVEVVRLEWTGIVHRPTNIRIRGYEAIIVNKNDCKPITEAFSYDNNSLDQGHGLGLQPSYQRAW